MAGIEVGRDEHQDVECAVAVYVNEMRARYVTYDFRIRTFGQGNVPQDSAVTPRDARQTAPLGRAWCCRGRSGARLDEGVAVANEEIGRFAEFDQLNVDRVDRCIAVCREAQGPGAGPPPHAPGAPGQDLDG